MSRSVLLQLARDSIEEVFQAQLSIDRKALLQEHPLLNEKIPTTINLTIDKELKGSHTIKNSSDSLLNNIIVSAKKAAFEDKESSILTTSEYLHCELEIILSTPDGQMSQIDPAIIQTHSKEN